MGKVQVSFIKGDYVFRWSGGAFLGVWRAEDEDDHVPYDMTQIPDTINRSRASRTEIEFVADQWLSKHGEETTAGLLREVLSLTDQIVGQITDEDVTHKYRQLMERIRRENI